MSPSHRLKTLPTFLFLALALGACKGAEQVCDPTDPLCGGGGGGSDIASIDVESPVDTVMAVGRTVPMTATARNSTGGVVSSATIVWNSTNNSVATVSGTGVVDAVAAGTTNIQASAGGQTGSLAMRAVEADLAAISAALGDAFRVALFDALGATPKSTLQSLLTTCSNQIAAGHVRAIDQCLSSALGVTSADTNDQALLGVLSLFFAYSQQQLNL